MLVLSSYSHLSLETFRTINSARTCFEELGIGSITVVNSFHRFLVELLTRCQAVDTVRSRDTVSSCNKVKSLKFLVVLFLSLLTQAIDLDSNILPFILDVMLQAPFSPPHLTFLAF